MRAETEVWSTKTARHKGVRPESVKILNPAFETVARGYISGVITEAGIFPSGQVHLMFEKKYPYLMKGYSITDDEKNGD